MKGPSMNEHDMISPVFVEDTTVSPTFTRWFPSWVWLARDEEGEWLWCQWAIARWKVTTGAMWIHDEGADESIQISDTKHVTTRQLRRMTAGNIYHSDLAIDGCLVPREGHLT